MQCSGMRREPLTHALSSQTSHRGIAPARPCPNRPWSRRACYRTSASGRTEATTTSEGILVRTRGTTSSWSLSLRSALKVMPTTTRAGSQEQRPRPGLGPPIAVTAAFLLRASSRSAVRAIRRRELLGSLHHPQAPFPLTTLLQPTLLQPTLFTMVALTSALAFLAVAGTAAAVRPSPSQLAR